MNPIPPHEIIDSCPDDGEDLAYSHIPVKPVRSVQVTYKRIGKLKPRRFPAEALR